MSRTGPREFVVTVYALVEEPGGRTTEESFHAAVERTVGRAQAKAYEMMQGVIERLRDGGHSDIEVESPDRGEGPGRAPRAGTPFIVKSTIAAEGDGLVIHAFAVPEAGGEARSASSAKARWMKQARREQARLVIAVSDEIRAEGNHVSRVELD